MGTSSSTKGFNLSQYQFVNEIIDPRFGEVKIYQRNETGESVCIIDRIITQMEHKYRKLEHPNLLRVHYYKAELKKELCSSFTRLQIAYEYVSNDLRSNITYRANRQTPYEETQLWGFLKQCLSVLQYLQGNDIYPLDMKNVMLSNQGMVKLHSLFDNHMTGYMQAFNQFTEELHLSPEELECLRKRQTVLDIDFERSEVFQLGLTTLYAASLEDTSSLFSTQTISYSEEELVARVNDLSYSSQFKELLDRMMQKEPQKRGTFQQIMQIVEGQVCDMNMLSIKLRQPQLQQKLIESVQYTYQSGQKSNRTNNIQNNSRMVQDPVQNQQMQQLHQLLISPTATPMKQRSLLEPQQSQQQPYHTPPQPPQQLQLQPSEMPRILKQNTAQNRLMSTQKPTMPQFNNPKLDNSKISQQSYQSHQSQLSHRSQIENKVEDALMKSKLALQKFNQAISSNQLQKNRSITAQQPGNDEYLQTVLYRARQEIQRSQK